MSAVIRRRDGQKWLYWIGRNYRLSGDPIASEHLSDAFHFSTYAAALQCAETHDSLRNSDVWCVAKLTDCPARSESTLARKGPI